MFKPIIAKSLLEIPKGKICGFSDENMSRLLISKGILIGSEAKLVRNSALGSTYYVQIDGLKFGLRKNELEAIQVTESEI